MLEHIAGRPSTVWKRNQILLVVFFWLSRVARGDPRGPQISWFRRLNRYLTRFSPWQIVVTTLTVVYAIRNTDSILGLGSPEPLAHLYSPDFFRATWVTTALDAGFATAMTIQPKFLRDIFSMVFFVYYLVYARDADEKLRRFRAICTVEMLRTTWNKTTNPYIRAITFFDRPRIPLLKRLSIPRPPGSTYTKPISVTIFFSRSSSLDELANAHDIIFDIPGGGFICMGPEHHEERLRRWTIQTGRPVVALNYSKAPEYPYPYALNEAFDLYRVLVESNGHAVGINTNPELEKQLKIVVSGDSAGSNLAVSLINRILETNSGTTSSQSFSSSKSRLAYIAYRESQALAQSQTPSSSSEPSTSSTPFSSSSSQLSRTTLALPTALVLAYPALDFNFTSWMSKSHLDVLRTEHRAQTQALALSQSQPQSRSVSHAHFRAGETAQHVHASSSSGTSTVIGAAGAAGGQSSMGTGTGMSSSMLMSRSRNSSASNLRAMRNIAEGKDHLAHKSPLAVVPDVPKRHHGTIASVREEEDEELDDSSAGEGEGEGARRGTGIGAGTGHGKRRRKRSLSWGASVKRTLSGALMKKGLAFVTPSSGLMEPSSASGPSSYPILSSVSSPAPVLGQARALGMTRLSSGAGEQRKEEEREARMRAVAAKGPATSTSTSTSTTTEPASISPTSSSTSPDSSNRFGINRPALVPLLSDTSSKITTAVIPPSPSLRSPPSSPSAFTSRMRGRVSELGGLEVNTHMIEPLSLDGPSGLKEDAPKVISLDTMAVNPTAEPAGTSASLMPQSSASPPALDHLHPQSMTNGYVIDESHQATSPTHSASSDVEDKDTELLQQEDTSKDYSPRLAEKDKPLSARVLYPSDDDLDDFYYRETMSLRAKRASKHSYKSRGVLKPDGLGKDVAGEGPAFASEITASPLVMPGRVASTSPSVLGPTHATSNEIAFERVASQARDENDATNGAEVVASVSGHAPGAVSVVRKKAPIGTRLTMTSRAGFFQDRIVSPSMMRAMAILYIGPKRNPDFATDYYISPILTPSHLLVEFPPVLLVCGEKDPFVDDTVIFGGRLREAKRAKKAELLKSAGGTVVPLGGVGGKGGSLFAGEMLRMSSVSHEQDKAKNEENERFQRLMYEDESDWVDMRIVEGWGHGFLQMSATIMLGDSARRVINEMAGWIGDAFAVERGLEATSSSSEASSSMTSLPIQEPVVATSVRSHPPKAQVPLTAAALAAAAATGGVSRKPPSPKHAPSFAPGSPSPHDVPPPRHPNAGRRLSSTTARPRRPSPPSNFSASPKLNPTTSTTSTTSSSTPSNGARSYQHSSPPRNLTSADLPPISSETETETETERDRPLSFTIKKNRSPPGSQAGHTRSESGSSGSHSPSHHEQSPPLRETKLLDTPLNPTLRKPDAIPSHLAKPSVVSSHSSSSSSVSNSTGGSGVATPTPAVLANGRVGTSAAGNAPMTVTATGAGTSPAPIRPGPASYSNASPSSRSVSNPYSGSSSSASASGGAGSTSFPPKLNGTITSTNNNNNNSSANGGPNNNNLNLNHNLNIATTALLSEAELMRRRRAEAVFGMGLGESSSNGDAEAYLVDVDQQELDDDLNHAHSNGTSVTTSPVLMRLPSFPKASAAGASSVAGNGNGNGNGGRLGRDVSPKPRVVRGISERERERSRSRQMTASSHSQSQELLDKNANGV